MPFVRVTRDKRGYEHTYLLHVSAKKGGAARLLYWYRTPPGVKVGRPAFDDALRQTLEAQYPSVVFDWPKLMETPVPPPDVEHWRERRRAEKAARQARQTAEREDAVGEADPDARDESSSAEADASAGDLAASEPFDGTARPPEALDVAVEDRATAAPVPPESPGAERTPTTDASGRPRRRRRRGGRRRRRGTASEAAPAPGPDTGGAQPVAAQGVDDDGPDEGPHEGLDDGVADGVDDGVDDEPDAGDGSESPD